MRRRDQQLTQRAFDDRIVDNGASSPFPVSRRRHSKFRGRAFVQPAAGTKSCIINRVCDRLAATYPLFELSNSTCLRILTRRNSHHAFESPLEVKGADPDSGTQRCQGEWFAVVFIDHATNLTGHFYLWIQQTRITRMAAKTGAKTCL